jgi:hypothetical protein
LGREPRTEAVWIKLVAVGAIQVEAPLSHIARATSDPIGAHINELMVYWEHLRLTVMAVHHHAIRGVKEVPPREAASIHTTGRLLPLELKWETIAIALLV